ncbi:hypothetical protein AB0C93_12805 [Streptomyces sp. NPDC048518]|uniref:CHAT domain-containing protein n=1 Tax=Streptomyces sp. NPDC048518 TaxID=3155029 RepID=UPI0033FF66E9
MRDSGEVDGLTRAEQACVEGESALERGDTGAAEKHFGVALGLVSTSGSGSGSVSALELPREHGPAEGDASGEGGEGGGGASEGGARVVARARTGAGRVLLARGEIGAAEEEFARASGLRPSAAGPLHWLGCAAAHRGDFGAAERHFTAALACAVPHRRSRVQRAYVRARAGDAQAALNDLRAAALTGPLDDEARWVLATLSTRSPREVSLRLRRAALTALSNVTSDGSGSGGGWERAGELIEAAGTLDGAGHSGQPDQVRCNDDAATPDEAYGADARQRGYGPQGVPTQWDDDAGRPGRVPSDLDVAAPDHAREPNALQQAHGPQSGPAPRDDDAGQPRREPSDVDRGNTHDAHGTGVAQRSDHSGQADAPGACGVDVTQRTRGSGHAGRAAATASTHDAYGSDDAARRVHGPEQAADDVRAASNVARSRTPGAVGGGSGGLGAADTLGVQNAPGAGGLAGHEEVDAGRVPREAHGLREDDRTHGGVGGAPSGGCDGLPGDHPRTSGRAPASGWAPGGLTREAWDFAPLYAVALVRSRRRAAAVALLGDAVRHDPADHRVTHALALALLHSPAHAPVEVAEPASTDRPDPTTYPADTAPAPAPTPTTPVTEPSGPSPDWAQCVAAWAALLHDDRFWAHVLDGAGGRYGVAVEGDLVPALRAGLREELERRMPDDDAGMRVAPGPLLQREADAAKLLAAVGGFPSPGREGRGKGDGGGPLVCGPLRIAQLDRTAEFGAFAAAQDAASPHHSLTYAFSELGFAQLLLAQDKARDALAALSELRCSACRAARGGPGGAAVCEPGCARFDELNPGYAGLPDKHRRLALDARGLALEARLSMGIGELTSTRPDFAAAAAYWCRALVHSRELDRYRETQTAIVDMALGAARAAHRQGLLSLAVSTLDATRSVIGANERPRLEGQLARVLADRGISVANDEEALLDQPAADLRRSVAFNPHLLRTQVSLGIVLRGLAAARWSSGSLSGAAALLREAIDQLTAALVHFPDDPDLEEQREAAVADLNHVMWQPDESEQ